MSKGLQKRKLSLVEPGSWFLVGVLLLLLLVLFFLALSQLAERFYMRQFYFVFSVLRYAATLQFSGSHLVMFGSEDKKVTNLNWASDT